MPACYTCTFSYKHRIQFIEGLYKTSHFLDLVWGMFFFRNVRLFLKRAVETIHIL